MSLPWDSCFVTVTAVTKKSSLLASLSTKKAKRLRVTGSTPAAASPHPPSLVSQLYSTSWWLFLASAIEKNLRSITGGPQRQPPPQSPPSLTDSGAGNTVAASFLTRRLGRLLWRWVHLCPVFINRLWRLLLARLPSCCWLLPRARRSHGRRASQPHPTRWRPARTSQRHSTSQTHSHSFKHSRRHDLSGPAAQTPSSRTPSTPSTTCNGTTALPSTTSQLRTKSNNGCGTARLPNRSRHIHRSPR